jgi:hypothetical protein
MYFSQRLFCILLALIGLTPTMTLAVDLMHLIIVADTLDKGIGADVDVANIQKLATKIKQATCLEVKPTVIDGGSVKPEGDGYEKVKNAISQLSVNSNDVVFFYYSGHGTNLGNGSRWPSLGVEGQRTPRSKLLGLEWVKNQLENKQPRLFIAMADACNVFPSPRGSSRTRQVEQPGGYRKLFLSYKGSIVASSSIPDQYSFGDPQHGGYFTQQFLTSLNEALAGEPDWKNIMDQATTPIPVDDKQGTQTPQAEVKVELINRSYRRDPEKWNCPSAGIPASIKLDDEQPQKNTCAQAQYHEKNGQKCCWDRHGTERCFNW